MTIFEVDCVTFCAHKAVGWSHQLWSISHLLHAESHHRSNMPHMCSILIKTCEAGVTIIPILPFKEQRSREDKEQAQCCT